MHLEPISLPSSFNMIGRPWYCFFRCWKSSQTSLHQTCENQYQVWLDGVKVFIQLERLHTTPCLLRHSALKTTKMIKIVCDQVYCCEVTGMTINLRLDHIMVIWGILLISGRVLSQDLLSNWNSCLFCVKECNICFVLSNYALGRIMGYYSFSFSCHNNSLHFPE